MAEPKCPNVQACPCQNTECERYGKCCACVIFHNDKPQLPACQRTHAAVKQ